MSEWEQVDRLITSLTPPKWVIFTYGEKDLPNSSLSSTMDDIKDAIERFADGDEDLRVAMLTHFMGEHHWNCGIMDPFEFQWGWLGAIQLR